ncbi:hypothetical protein HYDPIDRAFT_156602 [Hydnomerulius pinastri MD-312]|uniref:Uncharacterized protein n=1 Tax=Hydnomerulius pinastri MD-312 TaxID=994086 RepID=A0A0C9VXY1_9AGAM|nr:hypothetical protein HYDPIDRAFT_156602 [Hydnomerulius pinastri MD-312]
MSYEPEKLFTDEACDDRVINEMHTADWWWKTQDRLSRGATITPIILSSDKTTLSQFRGDKSAWPLYLTIGNISKSVRRQPSSHATVLIGYLPVGKYDCFSDKAKQFARYRMFHYCMRTVLQPLIETGKNGKLMSCADGLKRWIWPIVAAYVADYPEQCLVACCMENRCPVCKVNRDERGAHLDSPLRDKKETLELLMQQQSGTHSSESTKLYQDLGIRQIVPPFWADLPHCDIFQAFTPDLLHQLHKGVFKDHLVKWCTVLVGEDEIDARFRAMSSYPGLRHFKNGISSVSQWTGTEHKEMQRVFVGLLAGTVEDRVMKAVKSVVDFIYFASLHSHTSTTLRALQASLDEFHAHKAVFVELQARNPGHFNIPKIHSMSHYRMMIELFGSADGFNTESPERLHIDYAKDAYRATNKKDYLVQMTQWLRRQENVDRWAVFLNWHSQGAITPDEDLTVTRRLAFEPSTSAPDAVADSHDPVDDDPEEKTPTRTADHAGFNSTRYQASGISYRVSAKHARPLRNVPAHQIISDHHASRFLDALTKFLQSHQGTLIPRPFDTFNLYKWISTQLPLIPEASAHKLRNVIRALPPTPALGRRLAQPAVFDFALVRTGEKNRYTDGGVLEGFRVAQVRAIFRLPTIYGLHSTHPLAYVEWFTPFTTPDPSTGLYTVSRSTRMRHPYAEIIEIDRIVRACHLIPKYGRHIDPAWTSANVGDTCNTFYFNPYIDLHIFCATKAGLAGCIGRRPLSPFVN